VDLFAGAEQQLRVGALRGLADSAELLVGDIKTYLYFVADAAVKVPDKFLRANLIICL
jgi:hypothetical protein